MASNPLAHTGASFRACTGAPVPPWTLVVAALASAQLGAALARMLFETCGTGGVVFLRTLFSALLFVALARPSARFATWKDALLVGVFGVNVAIMMLAFYASIARIPLGVSVALTFAGPLVLAVAGSRRRVDLLWVGMAGAGVLLLTPLTDADVNMTGVLYAFAAAAAWAGYIVCSPRVSRALPGSGGLALGMCIAALVTLPAGLDGALAVAGDARWLLLALGVTVFASAIPYSLEFQALRRVSPAVFGLLAAVEPVIAAIIGWLFLGEAPGPRELAGILLITAAAGSAMRPRSVLPT